MPKKLSAPMVEKIKATETRQEIADALCTGLYLIVQPVTGAKSWQVRYRTDEAHRRQTLGKYPLLPLSEARERAQAVLRAVMDGGDPAAEAKAEKAAKAAAAEQEIRNAVRVLIEDFDRRYMQAKGLRSRGTVKRELDRHVVSVWGDRDVSTITKRDVIDLLDKIADSGRAVTANRVRSYLSKFFNWCVERDVIPKSPAMGVKPVAKEVSRERALTPDEIRWLWRAADQEGFPFGHMAQVLLLTGQRLGEVCGMSPDEIEGNLWTLPGERVKNKKPHAVPLSQAVLSVLAEMPRVAAPDGRVRLLFTTTGTTPVSGFHKARADLHERMSEIAAQEAGEPVDIPHWTFHDLRRTAATGMAELLVPVRVTEAVLNHISGTAAGIVSVYQRYDYADQKREALDAWAARVASIVNPPPPNPAKEPVPDAPEMADDPATTEAGNVVRFQPRRA